ncbi:outer membrane beta-barrel protein [Raineya sp.]|jgi:opacity protein-like surface antigen
MRTLLHIILGFFFCTISAETIAQRRTYKPPKKDYLGSFDDSQWWIGIHAGVNLGKALPLKRYDVLEFTNGNSVNKEYDGFRRLGLQAGARVDFNFLTNFSASFQPTYNNMNVGYEVAYQWQGQDNNFLDLRYNHRIRLNYLELPLLVRFDVLRQAFKPYVQGGIGYGMLIKADKYIEIESFDRASGANNPIQNESPVIGAKNLFITSQWIWYLGGGISTELGNVRLGLELNYKQGLNNITNRLNRYSDQRMIGVLDALDDMTLQNIQMEFYCVFPMKFLQVSSFRRVRP